MIWTEQDINLLALRGLQISTQDQASYGRFLQWLGEIAPESTARLRAIHGRSAGLSVIIPVSAARWPHDLLGDLALQDAAPGSFEVILVDRRAEADREDRPQLPCQVSVHTAGQASLGAACNAGMDAAGLSHVVILQEDCRVSTGFVSGLLAICGPNAIALARIGNSNAGATSGASHQLELCYRRHFQSRSELTSDQAVTLAPVLLSETGKAFPALYSYFVRFNENQTGYENAVFWAKAVATFHPVLRGADVNCVHSMTRPGDEGRLAPGLAEGTRGAFLAALDVQRVGDTQPHPILDEAVQLVMASAQAWLSAHPTRIAEALREARQLDLPPDLIDRGFRNLCLTATPSAGAPRVSVIVPVHNTAANLERCLASILDQRFADFELIVVDDASSDGSLELLLDLAKRDTRIRVFAHSKARGPGGARNTALRHAKGSYISFVDSDDYVAPDYLRLLYEGAEDGYFDIVVCGAARTTEDGSVIGKVDTDIRRIDPVPHDADVLTLLTPALWNKLWRASVFEARQPFFPEGMYFQDAARMPGLVARARAINRIGAVLYSYIQRDGNITRSYGDKHLMDYLRLFDLVKQDLVDRGIYEGQKQRFASWIDGQVDYHARSISSPHREDGMRAYMRHLQIIRHGYKDLDDNVRRRDEMIELDMLLRHSGLI